MVVSSEHEALHRIFRHDPALFTRIMSIVFGVTVAAPSKVTMLSTDLTETDPLERRADSVIHAEFMVEDSVGSYIMLIESQTDPKETRRRRWPYYIAFLHDKYHCPVVLLVVCSKAGTAVWAREPIEIGLPGAICMLVRPFVMGPDNVPAVTSLAQASSDLPLAVFSALTHSRGPEAGGILEALVAALDTIDTDTATFLAEFTEAGLGDTVGQQIWRMLMASQTFPYVSQLRSQGRAEGRAADILRILDKRRVAVDDASRERIESCTDIETLGTWLDRSLTAKKATDLFD